MVLVVPSPPSAATAAAVAVTLPLLHEFTGSLFRLHQRRRLVVTRVPLPDDAVAWTSGSASSPTKADCLPLCGPPPHVLLASLPSLSSSSFSVFVALFRDFRFISLSLSPFLSHSGFRCSLRFPHAFSSLTLPLLLSSPLSSSATFFLFGLSIVLTPLRTYLVSFGYFCRPSSIVLSFFFIFSHCLFIPFFCFRVVLSLCRLRLADTPPPLCRARGSLP